MLKIVAIGGSWFGMENISFSYSFYSLVDIREVQVKEFVEIRVRFED
jgi:hypothetical protein